MFFVAGSNSGILNLMLFFGVMLAFYLEVFGGFVTRYCHEQNIMGVMLFCIYDTYLTKQHRESILVKTRPDKKNLVQKRGRSSLAAGRT